MILFCQRGSILNKLLFWVHVIRKMMNFYIENKNTKYVDKLKKQWYIIFVWEIKTSNVFINLEVDMKLLRITAEGLPLFKEKLDLSFYAQ